MGYQIFFSEDELGQSKLLKLFLLLTGLLSEHSFAYVVSYSSGNDWYAQSHKPILNINNSNKNLPNINNTQLTHFNQEIFVAKKSSLKPHLDGQVGLALNNTSNLKINSGIFKNPSAEPNSYQYYISHSALSLKGKLFSNYSTFLHPYLGASVGLANNKIFTFNQLAKQLKITENYNIPAKNLANYTYTFEGGFQQNLNKNWAFGFGYQFANLGKNKLGPAYLQFNKNSPYLTNLYINTMQIQLSVNY